MLGHDSTMPFLYPWFLPATRTCYWCYNLYWISLVYDFTLETTVVDNITMERLTVFLWPFSEAPIRFNDDVRKNQITFINQIKCKFWIKEHCWSNCVIVKLETNGNTFMAYP